MDRRSPRPVCDSKGKSAGKSTGGAIGGSCAPAVDLSPSKYSCCRSSNAGVSLKLQSRPYLFLCVCVAGLRQLLAQQTLSLAGLRQLLYMYVVRVCVESRCAAVHLQCLGGRLPVDRGEFEQPQRESELVRAVREDPPDLAFAIEGLRVPGRKHVSGWQQQLVSLIGVPDWHTPCHA